MWKTLIFADNLIRTIAFKTIWIENKWPNCCIWKKLENWKMIFHIEPLNHFRLKRHGV